MSTLNSIFYTILLLIVVAIAVTSYYILLALFVGYILYNIIKVASTPPKES